MAAAASSLFRNRKLFFVVAVCIFLSISYSSYANFHHIGSFAKNVDTSRLPWKIPCKKNTKNERLIANGTLGFGAIYALGLSDRSDKRDGFELAASLTGLQITWVDGVLGSQMNDKAVPPDHFDPTKGLQKDGEIGCWRGHMNIMQKIVKSGVASALVLEDDSDWDLHIVQQMQQFAVASNEFIATTPPWERAPVANTGSPYGEGWDVLWIGHCSGWAAFDPEEANLHTVIRGDPTVPPHWDIVDQLREYDLTDRTCAAHAGNDPKGIVCDNPRLAFDERIVQQRTSPLCTTGYAVSAQGAKKMLARMGGISVADVTQPIDWAMITMCREELRPGVEAARCLTVSPPYIASHRTRGPKSLDSDIQTTGQNHEVRDVATTKGLVWSTRMNIENLIGGFEPETQYVKNDDGSFRYRKKEEYRENQRVQ